MNVIFVQNTGVIVKAPHPCSCIPVFPTEPQWLEVHAAWPLWLHRRGRAKAITSCVINKRAHAAELSWHRNDWRMFDINSLVHWEIKIRFVKMRFLIMFYGLVSSDLLVIMPSVECHGSLLMICQHWFRRWLAADREQAITRVNVGPVSCRRHQATYCDLHLSHLANFEINYITRDT